MSNSTNGPILVGGIPIVWVVVLSCFLIVVGVCALSYPLILLNRWRMREKNKLDNEEEDEDDEDDEPERRPKLKGGSIFGRGRPSMRGKWVERTDPSSNQPYYEHTGTGEVTWTDPRPAKMRGRTNGPGSNSLVASSMMHPPGPGGFSPSMAPPQGYGAPGGFGAPRPPMPGTSSMGMMPPMMPQTSSMGNVLPPQMQAPPRMPAGQPFPGPMGGAPPQMYPQGNAPPPGLASAGSMRRTQAPGAPAAAPAPPAAAPAADPKFEKYARMQKAGLPEGAIRNAMNRDGLSEADQKAFLGS